jgi:hypothetical protein
MKLKTVLERRVPAAFGARARHHSLGSGAPHFVHALPICIIWPVAGSQASGGDDVTILGLVPATFKRMIEANDFAKGPSGSNLTFESRRGFPADSIRASLADANGNFHYAQAR